MPDGALKDPAFAGLPPTVTEMKRAGVSQPEDRHQPRRPRDLPFLMDGDFFHVHNRDTKTLDFRWAKKHYTIEPGDEGIVPFEALVNQLGDPRSQDNMITKFSDGEGNRGVVMDRHAEITRLFAMYAVENEDLDTLVARAPRVTVTTLSGQAVQFPVSRPDMMPFPAALVDDHSVAADTTRMIDAVAAENAELRAELDEMRDRMDRELARREGVEED